MPAALIRDISHGLMSDFSDLDYPCRVYGFTNMGGRLLLDGTGTIYGFVWQGQADITVDRSSRRIDADHYFCISFEDGLELDGDATGFCVMSVGYRGLSCVGGPVEQRGRLRYIDGCSDTLLVSPPIQGEPCLNLLHFPPQIQQTMHTHPTIRAGLIHQGQGFCQTQSGSERMQEGKMFILYPDAVHAFSTQGTEGMTLTVFHPDTDFGPTHENHPMLNRTIVEGVSAKHIDAIRTKVIS